MKYYSDNLTVQKALNTIRPLIWWVFIVVVAIVILAIQSGTHGRPNAFALVALLSAIVLVPVGNILIPRAWFSYWLARVSEPAEFYQRAVRLKLINPAQAKRIADRVGRDVRHRKQIALNLQPINAGKKIDLTPEGFSGEKGLIRWQDIQDFGLYTYYKSQLFQTNFDLVFHLKDGSYQRIPIHTFKPAKLEYEIDRYLNAFRETPTSVSQPFSHITRLGVS
jgi:hypothetical protein